MKIELNDSAVFGTLIAFLGTLLIIMAVYYGQYRLALVKAGYVEKQKESTTETMWVKP